MSIQRSFLPVGLVAGALFGPPAQAFDLGARDVVTASTLGVCGDPQVQAFRLPGTETCLRISGDVVAEYAMGMPQWRGSLSVRATTGVAPVRPRDDRGRPQLGGQLALDLRVPTELGPVRAYVSLRKGRVGW